MAHEGENIVIKKGQKFRIALKSNPTSGYSWVPIFDKSILNLISRDFRLPTTQGVGQSGEDVFIFRAVNFGSDKLKMLYKRGWEKQSTTEKIFVINVV